MDYDPIVPRHTFRSHISLLPTPFSCDKSFCLPAISLRLVGRVLIATGCSTLRLARTCPPVGGFKRSTNATTPRPRASTAQIRSAAIRRTTAAFGTTVRAADDEPPSLLIDTGIKIPAALATAVLLNTAAKTSARSWSDRADVTAAARLVVKRSSPKPV